MKNFHHIYKNSSFYIVVAVAVGVIGSILLIVSHAQTPAVSVEAENGTMSGPASLVTDSAASGGRAVKFNTPPSTQPPTGGNCTVNSILVDSCGPWLGARSTSHSRASSSGLQSQLDYHESLIGRHVNVVHDYANAGQHTLSSFDISIANRANTYLFLNYKPAGNWSDASGGNATVNGYIDQMAASIKKNVGSKKMFITIWHEPENDLASDPNCSGTHFKSNPAGNTPAAYKAMWQNVRKHFANDGVNNIVWAVDYMNYPSWICVVPDLYPGDNLVDWIVFNGYSNNGGTINWDSIISRFYTDILTKKSGSSTSGHDYLSKPWGISEWGIDANTQANAYQFYDNVKASLDANTFPNLKLYMVFDAIAPAGAVPGGHLIDVGSNLQFDQTEVNHYKALANDPKFANP